MGLVLISLSPLFYNLFLIREYDLEQFYVPPDHSVERVDQIILGENKVHQQFTARADLLVGFDFELRSGEGKIGWSLLDGENAVVRGGVLENEGESRITKVRFDPIQKTKDDLFTLYLMESDTQSPPKILYSSVSYCQECSLKINGHKVTGNINMVPVYKAADVASLITTLSERIKVNISFYR